jgi:hypothetical protein
MRIFFTLIWSLAFVSMYGQNMSFIPFGQNQSSVMEDLTDYERFLGEVKAENKKIVNKLSENRFVSYSFQEDQLFQIEDVRYYESKVEANEAKEACLAYLSLFRQAKVLKTQGGINHYASIMSDRVVEVIFENDRKSKMTKIILRSTSRYHGPRMQTEELISVVRSESSFAN